MALCCPGTGSMVNYGLSHKMFCVKPLHRNFLHCCAQSLIPSQRATVFVFIKATNALRVVLSSIFVIGVKGRTWWLSVIFVTRPNSTIPQGSYGSWKTWKVMEFRKKNSRPGKSWNFDQSHGKSWKIVIIWHFAKTEMKIKKIPCFHKFLFNKLFLVYVFATTNAHFSPDTVWYVFAETWGRVPASPCDQACHEVKMSLSDHSSRFNI